VKRYSIRLQYKGTAYFGWQKQPREISIQEVIEDALFTMFGKKERIPVVGCGRTDTGVHAKEYYLHLDLPDTAVVDEFRYKINRLLPKDIAVLECRPVKIDWHARYDARDRTYRYFIHRQKDAFLNETSCQMTQAFDLDKMNEACQFIIGKQDFTSFSKVKTEVKSNICEVRTAQWFIIDDNRLYFEISADRFLRNMVRATVGTILDVGYGKIEPKDVVTILNKKDRGAASQSVPAQGLFLWKVKY
jgi:tRNA pseudouridine38-40 synthase